MICNIKINTVIVDNLILLQFIFPRRKLTLNLTFLEYSKVLLVPLLLFYDDAHVVTLNTLFILIMTKLENLEP